jgi:hypothetical protein
MHQIRPVRTIASALTMAVLLIWGVSCGHAEATLLLEEPYGFFGTLNPTGHTAMYFSRICAETPAKLRRCEPGEEGTVVARYQGIAGYDWVAMPLIPYLYSVEDASEVPDRAVPPTVHRMRNLYHEDHLTGLGKGEGNFVHGGWTQLVGASYERRIYAFRFATTQEQDDKIIARLNGHPNRSHFNLVYNNCADFVRSILEIYFPHTFRRHFFPDAWMTTPREMSDRLSRYAKKHPEMKLEIFDIPQIPGNRRPSHANQSVTGSLMTTGYVVPIVILNPYVAGGLFLDYLVRGRYQPLPKHLPVLSPNQLSALARSPSDEEDPDMVVTKAPSASGILQPMPVRSAFSYGTQENAASHE